MADRDVITADPRRMTIGTLKYCLLFRNAFISFANLGRQFFAVTGTCAARQNRNIGSDQASQVRTLRNSNMTNSAVFIVVVLIFVIKLE